MALSALAVSLVVAVPLALAADVFTDVSAGNPFQKDIEAIAKAGVTQGKTCDVPGTPPTYCPSENVTREAMAAFMHRGFGRVSFGSDDTAVLNTASSDVTPTDQSLFAVQLTPGLPATALAGAAGFVSANASVNVQLTSGGGSCPCLVHLGLWSADNPANGGFLDGGFYAEARLSASDPTVTVPLVGAMRATGTGAKTVVVVGHYHGTSETFAVRSNVLLSYAPFGKDGTDVGPSAVTTKPVTAPAMVPARDEG